MVLGNFMISACPTLYSQVNYISSWKKLLDQPISTNKQKFTIQSLFDWKLQY